ncbi:Insulin-like peptide 6 [Operophtera brumata]|uniref:Insulin-like peptide 6 n=1 Tax=Operophtera brumata TaxID=104452 RepID=A0A0L7LPH2_OPEBR|nr:Insulin-like peptide 6 [Operophtera brumata]
MMLYGVSEGQDKKVFHINDVVSSCSSWLSTMIFDFCNNDFTIVKRDTSLMLEIMAPKNFQRDRLGRSLLSEGSWKRSKRQVANECCLRTCTVGDVIMYCPDDSKLLLENPGILD